MTSENLKKVAVDSNAILSAVIGKAALQIFLHSDSEFVTTQFNLKEVQEYLPRMAAKYELDERLLLWQFTMLPLRNFPEKYYKSHFAQAKKLLKGRDPDDLHLLALALKEKIPIWSNDKDFENLSVPVYSTAQFLKILKKD